MADKFLCRACSKLVSATKNNRYRSHTGGDGESCVNSSDTIPDEILNAPSTDPSTPELGKDFEQCPNCDRAVKLTRLGYFEQHDMTLRGGDRCPKSGTRLVYPPLKPVVNVNLPGEPDPGNVTRATQPKVSAQKELAAAAEPATEAPSAEDAADALEDAWPTTRIKQPEEPPTDEEWAEAQALFESPEKAPPATSGPSPESTTTSTGSAPPETGPSSSGPFPTGPSWSTLISQPPSLILQPEEWTGTEKPEPLDGFDAQLATRIKELFYAYDNRKTHDNRSAQTTLGPSEIGTPCDRRLAMALMGIPAVNPGGDGWAAFVGTMGHIGMGEMLAFADAGTGRFAVELPLTFQSAHVPKGTTDALDRRDATLIDWKFMGEYSLKKFKLEGPSPTYRVQAHTYGLGAEQAGEKVKRVAIVGLPRAGGSLDQMHVWSEPYDRKVAEAALKRVDEIASQVEGAQGHDDRMTTASTFDTADDCRYCPFLLKKDKEMKRGCPGV